MREVYYRIQAVSKMTNVPATTLRAWERRYGLPHPIRSESSYRLYTTDDISNIRLIKELCEQGISTSEAVYLIKQGGTLKKTAHHLSHKTSDIYLNSNLIETTKESPKKLNELTKINRDSSSLLIHIEMFKAFQHHRDLILKNIRRFDPVMLEQNVRQAILLSSAQLVFDHIFAPVLKIIGEEWHAGSLSIAQEHLATEIIENTTRDLLRMVQPRIGAKKILLACIEDELHSLPLYASALHFVQWGYRAIILGANTPAHALDHSIQSLQPDVVGLSITQPITAQKVSEKISPYAQACANLPWVVGGGGAYTVRSFVERAGGLISTSTPDQIRDLFEKKTLKS